MPSSVGCASDDDIGLYHCVRVLRWAGIRLTVALPLTDVIRSLRRLLRRLSDDTVSVNCIFHVAPIFNALLGEAVAPHVVLINVIEAFVDRLGTIGCVGHDEILTEATPEASELAAQPIIPNLLLNQNSAAESMVLQ
jgi:hypothetical protein